MESKKRAMVSYENMSDELAAAFAEKFPKGPSIDDVKTIEKPNGDKIYTVEVEIPSAIYLVKVKIQVDDPEDVNKWLDDAADDGGEEGGEPENGSDPLPDDNIAQYSNGDDDVADND